MHDASVINVTAHICAGDLKEDLPTIGFPSHSYLVYFFNVHGQAPKRDQPFLNKQRDREVYNQLKLVRTLLNYRVLGTSTTAIFLSNDHSVYARITSDGRHA